MVYLSPGVYVEELLPLSHRGLVARQAPGDSLPKTTPSRFGWRYGAPITLFVGLAPRGPVGQAMLVTSWSMFTQSFGTGGGESDPSGETENAYLAHAVYGYFLNGGELCYVRRIVPTTSPALIGSTALDLDGKEQGTLDASLICAPDIMGTYLSGALSLDGVHAVQQAMIHSCEANGSRMAVLDTPPGLNPQAVREWRIQVNYDTAFASLYYPWIQVPRNDGRVILVPPCGHVAGIYARNDLLHGIHKQPANELIRGALALEFELLRGEMDTLYPIGINPLRSSPGRGLRVWGSRTLSSDSSQRYVGTRRLLNYIKTSIKIGTEWILYERSTPELWSRIESEISGFLHMLWSAGVLYGEYAEEAYFVKCDAELNLAEARDVGQIVAEVGLAVHAGPLLHLRIIYHSP